MFAPTLLAFHLLLHSKTILETFDGSFMVPAMVCTTTKCWCFVTSNCLSFAWDESMLNIRACGLFVHGNLKPEPAGRLWLLFQKRHRAHWSLLKVKLYRVISLTFRQGTVCAWLGWQDSCLCMLLLLPTSLRHKAPPIYQAALLTHR